MSLLFCSSLLLQPWTRESHALETLHGNWPYCHRSAWYFPFDAFGRISVARCLLRKSLQAKPLRRFAHGSAPLRIQTGGQCLACLDAGSNASTDSFLVRKCLSRRGPKRSLLGAEKEGVFAIKIHPLEAVGSVTLKPLLTTMSLHQVLALRESLSSMRICRPNLRQMLNWIGDHWARSASWDERRV